MRNRVMKTFALAGVALMLVLAGCGDDDDSSEGSSESSELPAEAESVQLPAEAADALAAYTAATAVDHDGDAMLAVVTEDFTFLSFGDTALDRDGYAAEVNTYTEDFAVEDLVDDVVAEALTPTSCQLPRASAEVASPPRASAPSGSSSPNCEWLVAAHRFTGD